MERTSQQKDCSKIKVNIGDVFQIGSSEVVVTQPRMPCYKLGVKFGAHDNLVMQFMESKLPGIYFRVLKEGAVGVEIRSCLLAEIRITSQLEILSSR